MDSKAPQINLIKSQSVPERLLVFLLQKVHGGGGLVAKLCLTLAIPWTTAHQGPVSVGFSRQEYWSGLPFPSPVEGICLCLLISVSQIRSQFPHWVFLTALSRESSYYLNFCKNIVMQNIYILKFLVASHGSALRS